MEYRRSSNVSQLVEIIALAEEFDKMVISRVSIR